MEYKIKFVSDDVMPDGHEWAICHVDGKITLYLRETSRGKSSREAAAILESAWEGYRRLTSNHLLPHVGHTGTHGMGREATER